VLPGRGLNTGARTVKEEGADLQRGRPEGGEECGTNKEGVLGAAAHAGEEPGAGAWL